METTQKVSEIMPRVLTEMTALQTTRQSTPCKLWRKLAESYRTLDQVTLAARDACTRFVEDMHADKPGRWLSLLGESGTGKTMLAKMVSKHWMACGRFHNWKIDGRTKVRHGGAGQYVDSRKLAATILEGAFGWAEDLCSRYETLVILDDIGSEYDSRNGVVLSALERILNARNGKWTLLTSNFLLPEIASRMDARIASRMLRDGGEIVEMKTQDFALRRK